jgi:hypothetical protein
MQPWPHNLKVAGSNPAPATNLGLMRNGLRKRNPFRFSGIPHQPPSPFEPVRSYSIPFDRIRGNQIKAKFAAARWRRHPFIAAPTVAGGIRIRSTGSW